MLHQCSGIKAPHVSIRILHNSISTSLRKLPTFSTSVVIIHFKMQLFSYLALALAVRDVHALLRFSCSGLVTERLDPLVNPGVKGSPHLHQVSSSKVDFNFAFCNKHLDYWWQCIQCVHGPKSRHLHNSNLHNMHLQRRLLKLLDRYSSLLSPSPHSRPISQIIKPYSTSAPETEHSNASPKLETKTSKPQTAA